MNIKVLTEHYIFSKLPVRPADSHKGTYGRLLNISGSLSYRGAASLSCLGALRAGVGLCMLASTKDVCNAVAAQTPEVMFCVLPDDENGNIHIDGSEAKIKQEISSAKTILIGCGIGDGSHADALLKYTIESSSCPVIIDADGLNALSRNLELLNSVKIPIILTPHPGEMSKLFGIKTSEVNKDRDGAALQFVKKYNVTLVLKGNKTLIASSDGQLIQNPTGNPGLAKGGSGDILAGIIAGLAAQGLTPFAASCCGVFLHGLSADKTAKRHGQYAMLPSEIAVDLAEILAENGR